MGLLPRQSSSLTKVPPPKRGRLPLRVRRVEPVTRYENKWWHVFLKDKHYLSFNKGDIHTNGLTHDHTEISVLWNTVYQEDNVESKVLSRANAHYTPHHPRCEAVVCCDRVCQVRVGR